MKSSPTKGDWWERFKEAVRSLPDAPINRTALSTPIPVGIRRADGTLFVGTSADIPQIHDLDTLERTLADSARLLEENQKLRVLLANAKHSESIMARRIEVFRKKWPAIHKDFFATERKDT